MKRSDLLTPSRMTEAQYTAYFLDGDDSLTRSRGVKQYPNNLVFTRKLLKIIGPWDEDLIGSAERHLQVVERRQG